MNINLECEVKLFFRNNPKAKIIAKVVDLIETCQRLEEENRQLRIKERETQQENYDLKIKEKNSQRHESYIVHPPDF